MVTANTGSPAASDEQRLDKWLWFARLSKTRTLAALLVESGKVRVNRLRAVKASQTIRPGDVLTIALRGNVRVVRVVSTGMRRGPAPEAQALYEPVLVGAAGNAASNRDPGDPPRAGSARRD
jgi:ribosome-associated heat shock protein Hsp15